MIRLVKGPEPAVLAQNSPAWTADLLQALANGEDVSAKRAGRYGHKDIKDAILKETFEKCAYCESKVLHIDYGDVEHIVPKSVDPKRTYEWANLTLACSKCNTNKGDKEGFLDPYSDDPMSALEFHGPWIANLPNNVKGYFTERMLKLNRPPLLERRQEKLDAALRQLEAISSAQDPDVRRLLAQALLDDARSQSSEYSACLSKYFAELQRNGRLPAGVA